MKPTRRDVVIAGGAVLCHGLREAHGLDTSGRIDDPGQVYPDDPLSRPLTDRRPTFETLDGVGAFLKIEDRARHFAEQDLRLTSVAGKTRTRWRFRPVDMPHNALFIQERIRRAPRAISMRIVNRSAKPISFELQAHELTWLPTRENTGGVWVLGPKQKLAPNEDRVLIFRISEAHADGRTSIRYPIAALLLVATELEANQLHEIELADLTVHYDPAPGITVTKIAAAAAAGAASFNVALTGAAAPGSPLDVEIRRDERVCWRIRLGETDGRAARAGSFDFERSIPWYLTPGRYVVGLAVDGRRVSGPACGLMIPGSATGRVRAGLPKVERRIHNGRPAVFVNDRPLNWRGYASYDYAPGNVSEFGRSGSNVFCIPAAAGRHMYQVAAQTWLAPNRWDFGELEERVCFSLQANPEAFITLRVAMALPQWWTQRRDQELVRVETDQGTIVWEEFGNTRVASLASAPWLADQEKALRALIRHCKSRPWASRLIGIWLMGETTEEWFAWGCNDGYYSDYSAPMAAAFARSAGGRPIPTPAQRRSPGWDIYPDTDDGRASAQYHAFQSELTAEVIGRFARVVKDETARKTLVGCFHGYVIQLAGEPRQALSGHFALQRVLDDPHVDMIAGVPLHDFRDLANGYNPYCSATESILASGKLVCDENDLFSWLHPILWHTPYDTADPRAAAISMHQRECANDAVHGTLQQKFSLAASWHHDAALQAAFEHQGRVYAEAMTLDRSPIEEVAFLVDDTSFAWTPPETNYLAAAHKLLLRDLGRAGAPVGVWLLSDAGRLPSRIRFIVAASTYAAKRQDLGRLAHLLAQGGRTVWVIGAPGLVDVEAGAWTPERVSSLLGMPIRIRHERLPGAVILTTPQTHVEGALRADEPLPSIAEVRPRPEGSEPGWLRYSDGPCAGLMRPLPNAGRLIWTGVPVVSTRLCRTWLAEAGVHLYAGEGYFVHAARDIVAVTSPANGEARLRWPTEVHVRDMLDGWTGSGEEFACPFRLGQTRLFRVRAV